MKVANVKTSVKIDETAKTLTFSFREKTDEKFNPEKNETYFTTIFTVSDLPQEIIEYAILHGLKQKLTDSLAWSKEDKATKDVSDAAKSLEDMWNQLKAGDWNSGKRGGGTKAPTIKLSDMEEKFLAGVKTGVTTWEAANELYGSMTGKTLPQLLVNETEDTEEEIN